LLFFAAQAALARGWEVRQVWWEAPAFEDDEAEVAWVCGQLAGAVDDYDGTVLVVGKSLGTLAVPLAAECGFLAAWLTPLLREPDVAAVLSSYPAGQFVAIGDRDPYLDLDVLETLPGERVLVAGDHILAVPGDPAAMVRSHEQVVRALDAWLAQITDGS